MDGPFRYRAFVSYSHADRRTAKRLQRALERYRLPKTVKGRVPRDRRVGRVFRDVDDLSAGGLDRALNEAIDQSEFLIVVCSPATPRSRWVGREIVRFQETGRAERIFPVVVAGREPSATLPAPLLVKPDPNGSEPLLVDLRREGWRRTIVRLVAGLLGLPFDDLWRRDLRRRRSRVIWTTTWLSVGLGGPALAVWAAVAIGLPMLDRVPFDSAYDPASGDLAVRRAKGDLFVYATSPLALRCSLPSGFVYRSGSGSDIAALDGALAVASSEEIVVSDQACRVRERIEGGGFRGLSAAGLTPGGAVLIGTDQGVVSLRAPGSAGETRLGELPDAIAALSSTADGAVALAVTEAGHVGAWRVADGALIHRVQADLAFVAAVATRTHVVALGKEADRLVWIDERGRETRSVDLQGYASDLRVSPSRDRLLLRAGGRIEVRDADAGALLYRSPADAYLDRSAEASSRVLVAVGANRRESVVVDLATDRERCAFGVGFDLPVGYDIDEARGVVLVRTARSRLHVVRLADCGRVAQVRIGD